MNASDDQIKELTHAVRCIAHGDQNGPTGMEMLAIAVAGEGLGAPLGHAIESVANALMEVADAIREAGA